MRVEISVLELAKILILNYLICIFSSSTSTSTKQNLNTFIKGFFCASSGFHSQQSLISKPISSMDKQFYSLMPIRSSNAFHKQSLDKIYQQSRRFSKTLGRRFGDSPLPSSASKQYELRTLADQKAEQIKDAIDQTQWQSVIYKRLEKIDQEKRKKISRKITEKDQKVSAKCEQQKKKQTKKKEITLKHLNDVHRKHFEIERQSKLRRNQQSQKLRESLVQFYEKQRQRKKNAQKRQTSAAGCYKKAIQKINQIQYRNEEFSIQAEKEHLLRMVRNSNKEKKVLTRSKIKSAENKIKEEVFHNSHEKSIEREKKYLQDHCRVLDSSLKCFDHKEKEKIKNKERIKKFLKERTDKWQVIKRRADQNKSTVPARCLSILEKTTKASQWHTISSSFHESSQSWLKKVQSNNSTMNERKQSEKRRILQNHFDISLRNAYSSKVKQQLASKRARAVILSKQCF